jgi:predicted DNA-binding transcriptional regulator
MKNRERKGKELSEELLKNLNEMKNNLSTLQRSPSQLNILLHIISSGRSLRVSEITKELKTTRKSVERALAKLYAKGLIQRSQFRKGAYHCNLRHLILCNLLTDFDIMEGLKQREG